MQLRDQGDTILMNNYDREAVVSVIVPVYNVEQYIASCIESILEQTFSDFELLLIDDGSTDSSSEICDKYEKQDMRVKVFHKANGGAASARNLGLCSATGTYIGFVDGDDRILPDMLERLYTAVKNEKADVAMCSYFRSDSFVDQGQAVDMAVTVINSNCDIINFYFEPKIGKEHLQKAVVWNKLYKRCLLNCIRFSENMSAAEDYLFNAEVVFISEKWVILQDELYFYRANEASATFGIKYQRDKDNSIAAQKVMKLLDDRKYFRLKDKLLVDLQKKLMFWDILYTENYKKLGLSQADASYFYNLFNKNYPELSKVKVNAVYRLAFFLYKFNPSLFMAMGGRLRFKLAEVGRKKSGEKRKF